MIPDVFEMYRNWGGACLIFLLFFSIAIQAGSCMAGEGSGLDITFLKGRLWIADSDVKIKPELIIYNGCQPVGLFKQEYHDSDNLRYPSIRWYTDSSVVFPEQMNYIAQQFKNAKHGLNNEIRAKLLKGARIQFVVLHTTDGKLKIVFEPSIEDPYLSCLLKFLRMPAFSCYDEVMSDTEIANLEISFRQVGVATDLNMGYSCHLITAKDMASLDISEGYFAQTHLYEKPDDINKWVGVLKSGDLYVVGKKVFLANLKVKFFGLDETLAVVKNEVNAFLK